MTYHFTLCCACVCAEKFSIVYCLLCPQLTFQVVLATDGRASFSFFNYQDPERVLLSFTQSLDEHAIGFDAGDQRRSATLRNGQSSNFALENVNVFRVDGMWLNSNKCNW